MNHLRKTSPAPTFLLALTLGVSLPSCIHITRTVEEPKQPVRFSSAEAAQTFYDATYVPPPPTNGKSSVLVIGLPMPVSCRRQDGPQRRFNRAVAAADTDNNGEITSHEARDYEAEISARSNRHSTINPGGE